MRIARVIRLALLASIFFAQPAEAFQVAVAFVAWALSTTTAAVAASTALTLLADAVLIGAAVGLSYVAKAIGLTGQQGETFQGTSGKLGASGVSQRTYIAGYGFTAGLLAYHNTWGKADKTPNAYYTRVIKLSDLPVTGLQQVFVGGVPVTYGAGIPDPDLGYAIPEYMLDGKDHLWVKFYSGNQGAADSWLVSQFGTDPQYPYTAGRVGYGVAYVIVTALVEPKLWSGWPEYKFALNGIELYDPRQDSTVGGSGAQRWDNPATWTFSNNPKVYEYNLLRGIRYEGQWVHGLQSLSASRLPLSSWFAAMNECDALVDTADGGTEKQFRFGGEISVGTTSAVVIDEISKTCNGRLAEIGGIYKTTCGAAGSPVLTFSDGDLLSTEQKTFDQFPGLSELVNGIIGSFPDPAQAWETTDAPALLDDDLEALDGDRQLTSNVEYNLVPYPEQVQRLMKSALGEARRFRKHTIPLSPAAWALEPLDIVAWNSTRNGYDNKLFRADLVTDRGNLDLALVITEVDPEDYDWNPETDFQPYVTAPLAMQRPAAQAIVDWEVYGTTIIGDDGRAKAAALFYWDTSDITDVNGIQYEIRRAADSVVVLSGETDDFAAGTLKVSHNLLSGTNYQGRGRYRPDSARVTNWSSWLSFTTPDVKLGAIDIAAEAIDFPALAQAVREYQDFVGPSVRQLISDQKVLVQAVVENALGAQVDLGTNMEIIRTRLTSETGRLSADYDAKILAATGPDSALVLSQATLTAQMTALDGTVTAVNSTVATLSSSVSSLNGVVTAQGVAITEVQATLTGYSSSSTVASAYSSLSATVTSQGSTLTATASSLSSLTTTVGLFSASGLFRVAVSSTQSGASATIAIGVSATGGGSTYTAAAYLSAMTATGKSRLMLIADQVTISNGTDNSALSNAFEFVGGVMYVKSAVIHDIVADTITVGTLDVARIASGALGTVKLATEAVTKPLFYEVGDSGSINQSAAGEVMCTSDDLSALNGYKVNCLFIGSMERNGGHSPSFTVQFQYGNPTTSAWFNFGNPMPVGGSSIMAIVLVAATAGLTINSNYPVIRAIVSSSDDNFRRRGASLWVFVTKR